MKKFLFFVLSVVLFLFALYHWKAAKVARNAPEKYTFASSPVVDTKNLKVLAALDSEFTELVNSVVPSVVSITTSKRVQVQSAPDFFEQFFGGHSIPREQIENSLGSGVVVSNEGHILTNNHVIDGVDEIQVGLADGRKFPARLIGADRQSDLAVLKIDAKGLTPLPFGDSDHVQVGQHVVAVGNPFGFEETVTQGIISAKGRRSSDSGNEYLQTDAAINPGNSGGPLINLSGEIIGINSAIFSTQKSKTPAWQGVGFAIPANFAKAVFESLLKHGQMIHGYLGVVAQSLNPMVAAQLQLPEVRGVLINNVRPHSPAEKAGLLAGDVLLSVNGTEVNNPETLRNMITAAGVDAELDMEILRNGAHRVLKAHTSAPPANSELSGSATPSPPTLPSPTTPNQPGSPTVFDGMRVTEIPEAHRAQLPADLSGVMVAEVDPNSPIAEVLQPGDVVEQINRIPVPDLDTFTKVIAQIPPAQKILLLICRDGQRSFVILSPE
ncbi:MAG: Do family serine endopeptidase [Chthoniobacteraceae bacterium]